MLKKISKKPLISLSALFLTAFVLRLLLTPFLTYRLDVGTYIAWSQNIFKSGFADFYINSWVDYLPGYPYILWVLAFLKNSFSIQNTQLLYKIPAIIADLATALVLFKLIRFNIKKKSPLPFLISAAYLFNPAIFSNSALWGQTDSFTALFALSALYLTFKNKSLFAGLLLGIGALIKINTIFIAPLLLLVLIKKKSHFSQYVYLVLAALVTFILGFVPFLGSSNLASFILERLNSATNQYQHTSLNAFNLWFLFEGSWQSDQVKIIFLTKQLWGTILFFFLSGTTLLHSLRQKKQSLVDYAQTATIIFLSAFLFLTRMHERHLFPIFPFLLILSVLKPKYWLIYSWFSFSYLVNLAFGYQFGPGNPQLFQFNKFTPKLVSLLNLTAFAFLFLKQFKFKTKIKLKSTFSKKNFLILILILSACARLFRLSQPPSYYFDEAYHAFTAREMYFGNEKAWEWWNTPPKGVAYEWTHPPLAKHFMVMGMQIFGPNAYGWRLPGVIFGTANIYLVYLLSKKLFKNKRVPYYAALLYSIESLSFVQSRIAMNDTYMISFMLLSIIALLNKKNSASALSFGLAFATKWSAIYLAPVLFLVFLLSSNNLKISNIIKFIIHNSSFIILVYLLSYLPFFFSNHSFSQLIELQKQMYWYHTRLDATHAYSSSWWSWPLLVRPVWYFVKYGQDSVANIYAQGNPLILWPGLGAVFYSLFSLLRSLRSNKFIIHNSSFIILLVSYASFLLPWALSPRVMFLYHYLPSIPFLVIILAWTLTKLRRRVATTFLLLALCSFVFFFPHITGITISKSYSELFIWFPSWK